MNNRKMASGILTILGAAATICLVFYSKNARKKGKQLIKTGSRLTEELKGKFNEFVDQLNDKVQGMIK